MKLFQRWCLLLVVVIISSKLFTTSDWQFWIIAIVIGFVCAPLHKKL